MHLKIAIQKSGRLNEDSVALLKKAGISIPKSLGNLVTEASNFPLTLLFLRDDDIPEYVAEGIADIGIVGENEVLEKRKAIKVVRRLGFSKCRMSLAVPKNEQYEGLAFFHGKKIATSYPNVLDDFLKAKQIEAEIHEIGGSVEIAPTIGSAHAIFDIVSTGSTLISNGLREVEVVLKSEALMVANPYLGERQQQLLEELLFRVEAVHKAETNKYILLNAPNEKLPQIIEMLPGMKSPTVLPLALEGWSSVHTVVPENEFWQRIDQLKQLGAQGILVVPIEKMII